MDYYVDKDRFIVVDTTMKDGFEIQTGTFSGSFTTRIIPWDQGKEVAEASAEVAGLTKITKEEFNEEKELYRLLHGATLNRILFVDEMGSGTLMPWGNDPRKIGHYDPNDLIFVNISRENRTREGETYLLLNKDKTFILNEVFESPNSISYSTKRELNPLFDSPMEIGFIRAIRRVLKALDIRIKKIVSRFAVNGERTLDLGLDEAEPTPDINEKVSTEVSSIAGISFGKEVIEQFSVLGARMLEI